MLYVVYIILGLKWNRIKSLKGVSCCLSFIYEL